MPPELDPELLEKKPERIRNMFADIASRYDLTNTILTGSSDTIWRNRTALELAKQLHRRLRDGRLSPPLRLLDACTGTGKLGNRILQHLNVPACGSAADFCLPLLKEGHFSRSTLRPVSADLLRMPAPDNTYDAVSIGFGYRNLADRNAGLREIRRLLHPDGLLAILEFHVPERSPFRRLYLFFFNNVLPMVGSLISRTSTGAYDYLNRSVLDFPTPDELKAEFRQNQFRILTHRPMMMGAVHLYILAADADGDADSSAPAPS